MKYPKIYLAIDNCFASKRWTEPIEWMTVIRDLGLYYVEASADNECDPLYQGGDFLADWSRKVKEASRATGVRVANLYSGHGTYATLGLAHTDERVRERFSSLWLDPMVDTAAGVGAGLGFFCHAFSDAVLQDPARHRAALADLYQRLARVARRGKSSGAGPCGVEQMYTPHQFPWTVDGSAELLREVYRRAGADFYLTIDVGHMYGQQRFVRPDWRSCLKRARAGERLTGVWMGPLAAYDRFDAAVAAPPAGDEAATAELEAILEPYGYLFAEVADSDPYRWLEKLGCWSPIIHLQQSDGNSSPHWPFTAARNAKGIIKAEEVLGALKRCYDGGRVEGELPAPCGELYLTLEMFSGTGQMNRDILADLAETVRYWRQFIPADGLTLDQLV